MSPRNEAKTVRGSAPQLRNTLQSQKRLPNNTCSSLCLGGTAHFVLSAGDTGNLLKGCQLSGDTPCLGLLSWLQGRNRQVFIQQAERMKGPTLRGCVGPGLAPATLTLRSSQLPPAPQSSQW